MNGLPKDLNLSFLLGKEAIQVCFGLHENIINFDGNTSITLECEFVIKYSNGDKAETCASCPGAARLLKILGSQITCVTNDGDGRLAITFSDGTVLTIIDSNPNYESYQISHETQTIVV